MLDLQRSEGNSTERVSKTLYMVVTLMTIVSIDTVRLLLLDERRSIE